MKKIPKQEYTTKFKEHAVKHVREGRLTGSVAKELGLNDQTLCNWGKAAEIGKLVGAGSKVVTQEQMASKGELLG
jgi:transposase